MIIIINILKKMGVKNKKELTINMIKPCLLVATAMIIIYGFSILIGCQSCGVFEASSNGSVALAQISDYYFGTFGSAILTTIVSLASIKTL